MRKQLLVVVFAVAALTASAQTEDEAKAQEQRGRTRFSVGFDGGLPIGNSADFYASVLGGSAKLEIPLRPSLSATVSGGYSVVSFDDKYEKELVDFNLGTDPEAYIPLKVGARYYFTKYIYGAGEIGAAFAVTKDSSTGFAWAPGVGISYPVIKKHEIDAGIRYESWEQSGFSTSQIGLHVAFKF